MTQFAARCTPIPAPSGFGRVILPVSTDLTVKSLGAWANVGEGSGVTIDGVLNVGAFVS